MVTRDSGYSKIDSISPERRRKSRERINDPNIIAGRYKLKELYAKIGIVVIPEKMTMWYPY